MARLTTDTYRTALFDYTVRIVRLLGIDSAAHCMALPKFTARAVRIIGTTTASPTYRKRHNSHGLPMLAHHDDVITGHRKSYRCFWLRQAGR